MKIELLCRDCPYLSKHFIGAVGSYYAYCKINMKIGVDPSFARPHSKCPLGKQKKQELANRAYWRDPWEE